MTIMHNDEKLTSMLLDDEKFMQWVFQPSVETYAYWREYMIKNPDVMDDIRLVKEIVKNLHATTNRLSDRDKAAIWAEVKRNSINKNKQNRQPGRHIWLRVVAAAAAVVLLLVVGKMFFQEDVAIVSTSDDYLQVALNDSVTGNNIRLVVSTGKHIDIEEDKAEVRYNNKGEVMVNSESVHIPGSGQAQMNCLVVPYGKTSTITLCDGSKIQVNSGSKLVFPSVFEKQQREIFLDGECFVEVTKDESRPFIVKTEHMDVRVTGTSFDVSSYNDEETNSVVLVSGSVTVTNKSSGQEHQLQPNQMFSVHTETFETSIDTADIYDHICWIYGFLHFNDVSLDKVLQKIERHYGVQMVYNKTQMSDIRVSGKLDLKENIGDVMLNIATTTPVKYEITNQIIYVNALK